MAECPEFKERIESIDQPSTSSSASTSRESSSKVSAISLTTPPLLYPGRLPVTSRRKPRVLAAYLYLRFRFEVPLGLRGITPHL